ncbi:MAG: class I SAM-dependent methyltransferase [Janthinobacterium lividum]
MPPRSKSAPIPSLAIHPFDRRHGTDTSGLLPGTAIAEGTGIAPRDLTAYYGVAPSILDSLVDLWLGKCAPLQPIEKTVFLDVGAGKGRAMLLASRHPFLRIEGVELNPQLATIAARNIAIWHADPQADALAPIVLHQADATVHPLPLEPTLAYLFHPFEAKLLRKFLHHVYASLRAVPRPFDLAYVNAEHDSLLDREPGLERLWMGRIPMSPEDHVADLEAIAQQVEYGSTGDELCTLYRTTVKQDKKILIFR